MQQKSHCKRVQSLGNQMLDTTNCRGSELLKLLSQRERQVFSFIIRGFTNLQIAEALNISSATVKVHRGNIYKKIEARSLSDVFQLFEVKPRINIDN